MGTTAMKATVVSAPPGLGTAGQLLSIALRAAQKCSCSGCCSGLMEGRIPLFAQVDSSSFTGSWEIGDRSRIYRVFGS